MPKFKDNNCLLCLVMCFCVVFSCTSIEGYFVSTFSTGYSDDSDVMKIANPDLYEPNCKIIYRSGHPMTETTQCPSINFSHYVTIPCGVDFAFMLDATHLMITNAQPSLQKLKDFTHLRYLTFKNATLSDLNGNAFQGLSLCQLSIVQCGLGKVHPDLFVPLRSLVNLDLSDNQLRHLADGVFRTLNDLLYLNLSKNNLKWIPLPLLQGLNRLKELDLSENNLSAVSYDFFARLRSVETIHLRKNQLRYFFDGDEPTVNSTLIHLDFSGNSNLPALPERLLLSLGRLENLFLENCGFKSVPRDLLKHLLQLKKLSFKNNYIERLPSDLLKESHFLKWLDLSANRLSAVPDGFFAGTPKITELQLSFNSFKRMPTLLHLDTLKLLNLSHNLIPKIVSNVIEEPSDLEILDLSHNFIEEASFDFVSGYKKLLVLQLSYNRLRSPPSVTPSYRESLEVMNISHNRLSTFEIPSVIPYGAAYDLRHNQIQTIDINISNFHYIKLIMSHREFLGKKVVSPTYYLSGNRINCDCALRNFLDFSIGKIGEKRGYSIVIMDEQEVECNSPGNRVGMSLREAQGVNLTCIISKNCPLKCSCYSYRQQGGVFVNCSRSNLFNAPSVLPVNTTVLDLRGNNLSSFSTYTIQSSTLRTLKKIYLRDNRLWRIQIDLHKSDIKTLDLRNNAFRSVPVKFPNHTTNLSLFIGGNPFMCDCPDMVLKNWMDYNRHIIADAAMVQCEFENRNFVISKIHQYGLCSKGTVTRNGVAIYIFAYLLLVLSHYVYKMLF